MPLMAASVAGAPRGFSATAGFPANHDDSNEWENVGGGAPADGTPLDERRRRNFMCTQTATVSDDGDLKRGDYYQACPARASPEDGDAGKGSSSFLPLGGR